MSDPIDNRIVDLSWSWRSTASHEAQLEVTVTPLRRTPTTEVRGRLTGPRCLYASTVEVAYPLRPPPGPQRGDGPLSFRVIIPEASAWEPESPFLYDGVVELRQDGQVVDRKTLRTAVLATTLGTAGLRVNGRALTLRGGLVNDANTVELQARRAEGWNLLLAPVTPALADLWPLAEEIGFFVIGVLADDHPDTLALAGERARSCCCFGWLASQPLAHPPPGRLGYVVEADAAPPSGGAFLVVEDGQVDAAQRWGLPLLVRGTTNRGGSVFGSLEGAPGPFAWHKG